MSHFPVEIAFFKALAGIKGQDDGRAQRSGSPCDLSGSVKGNTTATDVVDQLQSDAACLIPEEIRAEVLKSYVTAYNKVLGKKTPTP